MRRLQPWHVNSGKRLTKAPKVFLRDSGLLHPPVGSHRPEFRARTPGGGGQATSRSPPECLISAAGSSYQPYHYRTARGDEIDLVLVRGGRLEVVVEVKRSTSPSVSAGFRRAAADVGAEATCVVHPGRGEPYASQGVEFLGLSLLVERLRNAG